MENFFQILPCPPAVRCNLVVRSDGHLLKLLLRGDALGRVSIFSVPEVSDNQLAQIQQLDCDRPPSMVSQSCSSLTQAWKTVQHGPYGVLSHVVRHHLPIMAPAKEFWEKRYTCQFVEKF